MDSILYWNWISTTIFCTIIYFYSSITSNINQIEWITRFAHTWNEPRIILLIYIYLFIVHFDTIQVADGKSNHMLPDTSYSSNQCLFHFLRSYRHTYKHIKYQPNQFKYSRTKTKIRQTYRLVSFPLHYMLVYDVSFRGRRKHRTFSHHIY